MRQKLGKPYLIVIILVILSLTYVGIVGSLVKLVTVQWDEFTDLIIAVGLSEHPFSGHNWDPSQARFAMYITAAAYRVTQLFIPNPDLLAVLLPISRWISILMTVLAIWGTFILGYRLFDVKTGLLAATLFTFSPYVLQFGYGALTHGDAFTVATVAFALITFERFDRKRTTFWLVCFAFCLALAIAAKFFLVILIPALITYHGFLAVSNCYRKPNAWANNAQMDEKATIHWPYLILTGGTAVLTLLALTFSLQRHDQIPATNQMMLQVARGFWLVSLLGLGISFWLAFKNFRPWQAVREQSSEVRWQLTGAWLAILSLSGASVLALFPSHIFNPEVIPSLFERLLTMDSNSDLWANTLVSIKLYLGLLLFKLGLPFGIATYIALIWAARKSITDRRFLLITLIFVYYGLLLAVLPLQQPFWLMSIYPLIVVVLSALIVWGLTNLPSPQLRLGLTSFFLFAFAWLIVGLVQVYPTFGYYGYELVGNRWLGNESRGHRALVTVTNDGSTEAIDWLRQNVPPGSSVVSYLDDVHIIKYLESTQSFDFELKHALQFQDQEDLHKIMAKADFVVVRLINDTGLSAPVSDPNFIEQFGFEPTYQILRGRGIYRMPIIQIYQRISLAEVIG